MMHLSVGILLLTALVAPFLYPRLGGWRGWLFALVPAGVCVGLAACIPAGGEQVVETLRWVPSLDVDLTFRLDGLSATFALLVTGIGSLIVLYASGYLASSPVAPDYSVRPFARADSSLKCNTLRILAPRRVAHAETVVSASER